MTLPLEHMTLPYLVQHIRVLPLFLLLAIDPDGKGIDIIIKCAYENFRKNPADAYNPIMYLMVTDFKLCEREEQIAENALNEYNETIEENEINIDDSFLD